MQNLGEPVRRGWQPISSMGSAAGAGASLMRRFPVPAVKVCRGIRPPLQSSNTPRAELLKSQSIETFVLRHVRHYNTITFGQAINHFDILNRAPAEPNRRPLDLAR